MLTKAVSSSVSISSVVPKELELNFFGPGRSIARRDS